MYKFANTVYLRDTVVLVGIDHPQASTKTWVYDGMRS
jgi:hypothetical protein